MIPRETGSRRTGSPCRAAKEWGGAGTLGASRRNLAFLLITSAILCAVVAGEGLAQCVTIEDHELRASDGFAGDFFGWSVSVSGNVAAIGASYDDEIVTNSGTVYVYRHDGSMWVEEQRLFASDAAPNDRLGEAVAASGDFVVAGAPRDDGASGSAYVFRFDGSSWSEQQKLTASDAAAGDEFGSSVAVAGDVAVVGAYHDGDAGPESGAAYVFRYVGTAWVEEQKLVASDAAMYARFGEAVATDGDVVVVGAPRDDSADGQAGSVYVFRFDGNAWVEEQKLVASDASEGDWLGFSVSVSRDVIAAGAFHDSDAGDYSGAAYVYRHDGDQWIEEQKLVASDASAMDWFAYSVALSEDVVVVGAYFDDAAGRSSGSAYVFRFDGSTWFEDRKLIGDGTVGADHFGFSVSVDGDSAVVGSRFGDGWAVDTGSAYVFSLENVSCRRGTVDLGMSPNAADVLAINGTSGGCLERTVTVAPGSPIEIVMDSPPSGPEPAPFVLYAWRGEPDESTSSPQPYRMGTMCFATFLSVGLPKPLKVWNNAGRRGLLGQPDYPSQPAPSTVVARPTGWHQAITVTFQGLIADSGTAADVPASVTNAVVLRVQDC